MENSEESGIGGGRGKSEEESLNLQPESEDTSNTGTHLPPRTPFTSLSQHDADLALARTLQGQERAYMMLRMGGDESEYCSSESGSFVDEAYEGDGDLDADGFDESNGDSYARAAELGDAGAHIDPSTFVSDEAYARALQDAEEREMAVHLMALAEINDWELVQHGESGSNSRSTQHDVDPDQFSYEELLALGDVVGTESRGLSADIIASLPSVNYQTHSIQDGNADQCVICRLDYEDGDNLVVLSCKHLYHSECIKNWLQINKICPVCSMEVFIPKQS